jgi:hypothetical protein
MQWRQATGRSAAPHNRYAFQTGLLMLACADIIRPSLPWMAHKASNRIVTVMRECRDPQVYAQLQDLIDADPGGIAQGQARLAMGRITMTRDLLDAMRGTGTAGARRPPWTTPRCPSSPATWSACSGPTSNGTTWESTRST